MLSKGGNNEILAGWGEGNDPNTIASKMLSNKRPEFYCSRNDFGNYISTGNYLDDRLLLASGCIIVVLSNSL